MKAPAPEPHRTGRTGWRRRPTGQRHPRPGDGCRRKSQVRPPRHADGHGRRRDRAVHPVHEVRPGRSGLARSRPLRAVGRPRLDADLRAASTCSATTTCRSSSSRPSASWAPHRRPPGIRSRQGHRDDHRPAGAGASPPPSAWRWPSVCSTRASAMTGRSLHLCDRRRRLPDGRHQPRGDRRSPGHLGLGQLIVLWDDNSISIDGATDLSTSTDQLARFEAAGWNVQAGRRPRPEAIAAAIEKARANATSPA